MPLFREVSLITQLSLVNRLHDFLIMNALQNDSTYRSRRTKELAELKAYDGVAYITCLKILHLNIIT